MEIKRDPRIWDIVVIKSSEQCEFLTYPANYHACNYPFVERPGEMPCKMENCPIRKYR